MTNRRFASFAYFLFTILFAIPLLAYAKDPDAGPVQLIILHTIVVLNVVIEILITLAFVVFGWGIIKLITAGGDAKKVTDAKGILTYGIIGIFVLASLLGILTFIKTYIGVPSNAPITAPKFQ